MSGESGAPARPDREASAEWEAAPPVTADPARASSVAGFQTGGTNLLFLQRCQNPLDFAREMERERERGRDRERAREILCV